MQSNPCASKISSKRNISPRLKPNAFSYKKVILPPCSKTPLFGQPIIRLSDKIEDLLRDGFHQRRVDVHPPAKMQEIYIKKSKILCSTGLPSGAVPP